MWMTAFFHVYLVNSLALHKCLHLTKTNNYKEQQFILEEKLQLDLLKRQSTRMNVHDSFVVQ